MSPRTRAACQRARCDGDLPWNRYQREEDLCDPAINRERARRHIEAERVRDARAPEPERCPKEPGAERATPAPPGRWDAAQTTHLARGGSLSRSAASRGPMVL